MSRKIIILSGGFDPIHSGHIAMFEESRDLGDIVVLLNSDEWLKRKKGNYFMDWNNNYSCIGCNRFYRYDNQANSRTINYS